MLIDPLVKTRQHRIAEELSKWFLEERQIQRRTQDSPQHRWFKGYSDSTKSKNFEDIRMMVKDGEFLGMIASYAPKRLPFINSSWRKKTDVKRLRLNLFGNFDENDSEREERERWEVEGKDEVQPESESYISFTRSVVAMSKSSQRTN